MFKRQMMGGIARKAHWIFGAVVSVFIIQAGLVFYTFDREAKEVQRIVGRTQQMRAAIDRLDQQLATLNRIFIGSAGGIYAPPGVAHLLERNGTELEKYWRETNAFFVDDNSLREKEASELALENLPGFLAKARKEYALTSPVPSRERRKVLETLYEEWLDYFQPVNRYTTSVRDVVPVLEQTELTAVAELRNMTITIVFITGSLGLLLVFAMAFLLDRVVIRPIGDVTETTRLIAEGNLSSAIPHLDREDEVGAIAAAINRFRDQILANEKLREEAAQSRKREERQRIEKKEQERVAEHERELRALQEERNELLRREVEERQSKEQELRFAMRVAENANRTKTVFLASMSHELRTPLNAIIGFTELLQFQSQENLTSLKRDEYLQDIASSARHLLTLINDLLDLSRIEQGILHSDRELLDVRDLLAFLVRIVRDQARKKQINIALEIQDDLPLVSFDQRQLRQIVLNLLSNAIKFTPNGGTVRLTTVVEPGALVLQVIDTGIGIAEKDMDKVFIPFSQISSANHMAEDGVGLGLALSLGYCRENDADLRLRSEPGDGTVAEVWIPIEPDRAGEDQETDDNVAKVSGDSQS